MAITYTISGIILRIISERFGPIPLHPKRSTPHETGQGRLPGRGGGSFVLAGQRVGVRPGTGGKVPVSRLLTFESDEGEPELPIIDLSQHRHGNRRRRPGISEGELDFAFLCRAPAAVAGFLERLAAARERRALPGY